MVRSVTDVSLVSSFAEIKKSAAELKLEFCLGFLIFIILPLRFKENLYFF